MDFITFFLFNMTVSLFFTLFVVIKYREADDFIFTYLILNKLTFIICYLLNHSDLSLGFAFGIFAIFSIIRYRTDLIPFKEMTYIFLFMSIAIVNSIGSGIFSFELLLFINIIIISITYLLEFFINKYGYTKNIVKYEKIENILPKNKNLLIEDLKYRTGLNIKSYKINNYNFLRDTVEITIYSK